MKPASARRFCCSLNQFHSNSHFAPDRSCQASSSESGSGAEPETASRSPAAACLGGTKKPKICTVAHPKRNPASIVENEPQQFNAATQG